MSAWAKELVVLRQPRGREKFGDLDDGAIECAAAWLKRMGVPGGRAVSAERLESER